MYISSAYFDIICLGDCMHASQNTFSSEFIRLYSSLAYAV